MWRTFRTRFHENVAEKSRPPVSHKRGLFRKSFFGLKENARSFLKANKDRTFGELAKRRWRIARCHRQYAFHNTFPYHKGIKIPLRDSVKKPSRYRGSIDSARAEKGGLPSGNSLLGLPPMMSLYDAEIAFAGIFAFWRLC